MAEFDLLFSPITVGPMQVPNRIVETTNTIAAGRSGDGLPDGAFIAHHVAKARGGVGWIGSETWVLPTPLPPGYPDEFTPGTAAVRGAIYRHPRFAERVGAFVNAVHEAGAVAVMQLTHLQFTMSASSVPVGLATDLIPHALEAEEIAAMITAYRDAAEAFGAAGADGLEIHAAHDTVPQHFLSPATNRRTDAYGGSPERRARFVLEAAGAVRSAVGNKLALGIRLCGDEFREGGYGLEDMQEIAQILSRSQLFDYLSVDVGSFWGVPSYIQPMQYPLAGFAYVAAALREVTGLPTVFSGRVNDPVLAERLLAEGQCDLVGMTRASIADPQFPRKAREGRLDDIRRCIGCNTCIGRVIHEPIPSPVCAVNPEVGREREWARVGRAEKEKRVVVAGAGPAGLEAARVAAARGHRVTVLERAGEVGGQLLIAARAPRREGFLDYPRWAERQLAQLGVELRLGAEATAESVLALEPDAVVVATGSLPRTPELPGVDSPHVLQARDVLAGKAEPSGRVVVIAEEDHMEAVSVADYLAERGAEVEIIHHWLTVGERIERYTRGIVFYWLAKNGVRISTGLRLRAIEGQSVVLACSHTGAEVRREGVDSVVLACGSVPDARLAADLRGRVKELHIVGSAFAPRRLVEATRHGAGVGSVL